MVDREHRFFLKVNSRSGKYALTGPSADPLVLLGHDQPLHVRVQVDENDLWRPKTGAPAEAILRGNRDIRFPPTFVWVEPYALRKRSATGSIIEIIERIGTRVL